MDINRQIILARKKAVEDEAKPKKKVRKTRKPKVSSVSSSEEQKEASVNNGSND